MRPTKRPRARPARPDSPRQRKHLSQIFLTTDWPAHLVAEELRHWGVDAVLEIGPGGGMLTRVLCDAGLAVTAIEKDARFAEALQMSAPPSLEVVTADFLEFDLAAWCAGRSGKTLAVVGNIPYHLSTPMVFKALEMGQQLAGIIFLVQEEFARRLAATPGNKDYGSLSVFVQLRAAVSLAAKVGKNLFKPVPKVDSRLVVIKPIPLAFSEQQLSRVEQVTRLAFQARRKMLSNSLKPLLSGRPNALELTIDLTLRPERLAVLDFVALTRSLFPGEFQ